MEDAVTIFLSPCPSPCVTTNDVLVQYLQGVSQIAVKLDVNMPAGTERVTSYATIDSYGVYSSNIIWIKLTEVNGVSPLSLSAVEYLKEQLPAEAFPGFSNTQGSGLEQVADALIGMWDNLKTAFGNPVSYLRSQGMAQTVVLGQCFRTAHRPRRHKIRRRAAGEIDHIEGQLATNDGPVHLVLYADL